ncbi:hypothetical protein, variant [Sphaeroforma arctica JP610]|uniref:Asparaginase n=1 Tax=Sphaeroforma arctica JP610 TaxID=667725 RepID=A0A0L0G5W9_9EUKA|nr:hypothetical protein, variant [Sphaeroforma arctica JP610]KNC84236.1 hypothetical protein, variant [Sphaeroforma arctica JP610]|eukprot:XP_014158138.1 hypothetical protein, variant [Sphaeroforma arctica JP610]
MGAVQVLSLHSCFVGMEPGLSPRNACLSIWRMMPNSIVTISQIARHHSESSRQKYKSNKQTLRDWREARVASLQSDAGDDCLAKNSKRARTDFTQDTVGAICSDSNGSVTSGVSSGGISLKMPGRVGEAALYGCGCYADSDPQKSKDQERGSEPSGVGVSISGTGEYIQRSMLALNCGQQLARENDADPATTLHGTITREMLDCRFLRNVKAKPVGVLAVKRNVEGLEVIYAHNTASFGLGYRLGDAKAVAIMSRLDSLSANTLKTSSIFCKYA